MLHCKECEKFFKFGGDDTRGVCSLPESYFPTEAESECVYLSRRKKTCKDCSHFGTDFACMTARADNPADACCGFIDKLETQLYEIFFEWLKSGEYSREKVENLCAQFEQTKEYEFVKAHKE